MAIALGSEILPENVSQKDDISELFVRKRPDRWHRLWYLVIMTKVETGQRSILYEALRSRDSRFDGLFFVGVKTTKIYCRPICSARLPLQRNCQFFEWAAQAQDAGYRPCLKCRPELAPGISSSARRWMVDRLLDLVRSAALEGRRAEELGTLTGWSSRQLRRKFVAEYGVTPVAFMQTERLLFAKRLLHETTMPMVQVACSSGFRSVRRFNAAFSKHCGTRPSIVRRLKSETPSQKPLRFSLEYRPPLDWSSLLDWLSHRVTRSVEYVSETTWGRTVSYRGCVGWVRVQNGARSRTLEIEISPSLAPVIGEIIRRVRHLFDLDANQVEIEGCFRDDPLLGPILRSIPGHRLPGAWDLFESAVRAVLGQQVSVAAATTLAQRLVEQWGKPCQDNPMGLARLAVTPDQLASVPVDELAHTVRLPRKRAEALISLAHYALKGGLKIECSRNIEHLKSSLLSLPGIGPWTAEYLVLRGLKHPDSFPSGDLGLRKAIGRGIAVSENQAEEYSQRWRPWRAYAAGLLWKGSQP